MDCLQRALSRSSSLRMFSHLVGVGMPFGVLLAADNTSCWLNMSSGDTDELFAAFCRHSCHKPIVQSRFNRPDATLDIATRGFRAGRASADGVLRTVYVRSSRTAFLHRAVKCLTARGIVLPVVAGFVRFLRPEMLSRLNSSMHASGPEEWIINRPPQLT